MITKMKKYTFLVFHRDYEDFLTAIRELGVVHIDMKAQGLAENPNLQEALEKADAIRRILSQQATSEQVKERQALFAKMSDIDREMARLSVLGDYSKSSLTKLAKAGYSVRIYTCSKAKFVDEWGIVIAEQGSNVYFAVLDGAEIADATEFPLGDKTPSELRADKEALKGLLAACDAKTQAWWLQNKAQLEQELKEAELHIDWTKVMLNTDSLADGALCLVEGFAPEGTWAALDEHLAKHEVYYEVADPVEEDNTPIKLHNNRFTQLFECLTGMYGWPTYGEFDPTPILAPFYLLFFSMCMGDAGYGLLLIAFGLLTHYRRINISMFEGLGPIITVLGVGTTIVGFMLGTFMGMSLYDAAWYPEALKSIIIHGNVAGFDAQMVLAIGIGVFHICLAMVVKAICYTRRYGFRANLSTWAWTLLIVGGIIVIAAGMLLNLPTDVTKYTLIGIGAVSAVGIYLLNTPGRNPLLNIGGGLWETYNMVTGLMGDVLSYVRLYALGLAGGMLGSAFNTLGNIILGGDPASARISWVFAIVVLLFGHLLNLAMSALGAFVHPLRLTFVEYFKNAGYEGKGVAYTPFKK